MKEASALLTSDADGSRLRRPDEEAVQASYESMAAPIAPEPESRAINVTPTTAVLARADSKIEEVENRSGRGTLTKRTSQRTNGIRDRSNLLIIAVRAEEAGSRG